MTSNPSALYSRHHEALQAVSSFMIQNDEREGVSWTQMRKQLVLNDHERGAEYREHRELLELRKCRKKIYDDKTAWEEIERRRKKPFRSKDQLYRTLRIGMRLGVFLQDFHNGPYRMTGGGLTTTVREREIYYLRNIPLERVLLGEEELKESIYGLTRSDLTRSEVAELDKIRADIQRLGEDLMMLQCKVLERRFAGHMSTGHRILDPESIWGQKGDAASRLLRAKMQLREEVTNGIARRVKRAKNKQRSISKIKDVQREFDIPIIAVVSPEVHAVLRHEIANAGRNMHL
jgi:hypothetical protein